MIKESIKLYRHLAEGNGSDDYCISKAKKLTKGYCPSGKHGLPFVLLGKVSNAQRGLHIQYSSSATPRVMENDLQGYCMWSLKVHM